MNHPLNPMMDPSGYPMNHPINLTDNLIGLKSAYLTDGSSDIRIDQIRIAPLIQITSDRIKCGFLPIIKHIKKIKKTLPPAAPYH